jgi:hypothetical protein
VLAQQLFEQQSALPWQTLLAGVQQTPPTQASAPQQVLFDGHWLP